jgi:alkanesulfonate monooxygenase SsuD/methylene tetrahydromethanopterin reductase-like flavin-dependent oxidoreductase (luciferase family)
MRIGLIIGLHGSTAEGTPPEPTWKAIAAQARAAEQSGFDLVVLEDALLYAGEEKSVGFWESVSIAAAVAASTEHIGIGHSVLNAPYRTPAFTAKVAETLDEISGGRFILGIGAGNTPDYAAFGFAPDKRFSRFAEGIEVLHTLLRNGEIDHDGEFHSARGAQLVLRGPRPGRIPLVIAAAGPKMLRLTARYADEWNWWVVDSSLDVLRSLTEALDRACAEEGRDPMTLRRSLDVYSVDPLEIGSDDSELRIGGSSRQIADHLLAYADLGFGEVRCNLVQPPDLEAMPGTIEAMAEVVELVHAVDSI